MTAAVSMWPAHASGPMAVGSTISRVFLLEKAAAPRSTALLGGEPRSLYGYLCRGRRSGGQPHRVFPKTQNMMKENRMPQFSRTPAWEQIVQPSSQPLRQRILVVEDQEIFRRSVSDLLNRHGLETIVAESGEAA